LQLSCIDLPPQDNLGLGWGPFGDQFFVREDILTPARGLLVTCMANGTVCGARSRLVGVSRKTVMRSSMNPSVLVVDDVGTVTAVGRD
jgi:hypothetical protein